ncbi:MAG: hypothetical protein V4613_07005 [Bacteroidota bacterium]
MKDNAVIVLIIYFLFSCNSSLKETPTSNKSVLVYLNDSEKIIYRYYPNGTIKRKLRLKFNVFNDTQLFFYQNGMLRKFLTIYNNKMNGKLVLFDSLGHKIKEGWYNNDSLILEYNLKKDIYKFPKFKHLDLTYVDKPELMITHPPNTQNVYLTIRTRLYPIKFYVIYFNNSIISDKHPSQNTYDHNSERILIINDKFKGKKVVDCDIEAIDYYNKVVKKWHYYIPF